MFNMHSVEQIKTFLEKNLTNFRYLHSLMVAEIARELALVYHVDEGKAYLAGLIHDIAKEFNEKKNKNFILKYGLSEKLLYDCYKELVHADIGALIAKEKFGFDEDICNAIKYHTIGNIYMDTFAKIIFIADKIGRKKLNSNLLKVKEFAYYGKLDQALLFFLLSQKKKLEKDCISMHPHTLCLIELLQNNC